MWLQYGVSPSKTLIRIEEVESGKTNLYCPYCGGFLTAKKGKVKQHHFSHTEETCYPVATKVGLPRLPLYDNFNIQLSGKSLQLLETLWLSRVEKDWGTPFFPELKPLIKARLLQKNPYHQPPDYEFTPLGQIPVGALPLAEFNTVQEPLLLSTLRELERKAELAKVISSLNRHQQLTNLWLYRAQLRRVLSHRLYFLQVRTDDLLLHKIGVTKRSIEQRLIEIKRDLHNHFPRIEIQVLGIWLHRGNVELYFKHRYQPFNYPIGNLTEYYKFDEVQASLVWDDLEQMQPKTLNSVELEILAGDDNPIEQALQNEWSLSYPGAENKKWELRD